MIFSKTISMALLVSTLIGCGAGFEIPPLRPAGAITGTVGDESVRNAKLRVFSIQNGEKHEMLGETDVGERGMFSLNLRAKSQILLFEVSGGQYIEAASWEKVELSEGVNLRALASYTSGESLDVSVSPLTHVLTALTFYENQAEKGLEESFLDSKNKLTEVFGLDVVGTRPWPIDKDDLESKDVTPEHRYGFLLAAISSWTKWVSEEHELAVHTTYNTMGFSQIIYNDVLADGLLDGVGVNRDDGTPQELYLGKTRIDADIYRIAIAQHMLSMANTSANKTVIRAKQLLDVAHNLATSRHPIFGEGEPGEFAEQGPAIYSLEAEDNYQNGVFHFAVAIGGITGAEKVEFFIDEVSIGEASDPLKPYINVDTTAYADGDHQLEVVATNVFDKSNKASYRFKFDNTGPIVNVTSSLITNRKVYSLSGNYSDSGVGVRYVVVQGQRAVLTDDGVWSAEVELEVGKNDIPLNVTDELDNVSQRNIQVSLDQTPPTIATEAKHSQAVFVQGNQLSESALEDKNSGAPLLIQTDSLNLNGVGISREPLNEAKVPFFAFTVSDEDVAGIFTTPSEIEVRLQHRINNKPTAEWRKISQVDEEYLVPLVSEGLDKDWDKANPNDEHEVALKVEDKAGNVLFHSFTFKSDFRVPEITISDQDIEEFNTELFEGYSDPGGAPGFSNRAELNRQEIAVLRYKYTNPADRAVYIRPSDDTKHAATRWYDEAVRKNKVRWTLIQQWRLNQVENLFNTAENSCPSKGSAEPVTITEVNNFNGTGWETKTLPGPTTSDPLFVKSDTPEDFESNWASLHFSDAYAHWDVYPVPNPENRDLKISYNYDYLTVLSEPFQTSAVANWTLYEIIDGNPTVVRECESVNLLEAKIYFTNPVTEPDFPKDEKSYYKPSDATEFDTIDFVVEDDATNMIESADGWFRIPANASVWIYKVIETPQINNYDQSELVSLTDNYPYEPLRYDRRIEWEVNKYLRIDAVHDAGIENIVNMTSTSTNSSEGTAVFSVTR